MILKDIGKLKSIWARFTNRSYREAFADARVREAVAAQIFFIRESRKLTQGELAELAGTQQPAISRIERGEAALTAKSLSSIARAFDVALEIRFIPYSELAEQLIADRIEAYVPSFTDDTPAALVEVAPTNLPKVRYSVWSNDGNYMPDASATISTGNAQVAINA